MQTAAAAAAERVPRVRAEQRDGLRSTEWDELRLRRHPVLPICRHGGLPKWNLAGLEHRLQPAAADPMSADDASARLIVCESRSLFLPNPKLFV